MTETQGSDEFGTGAGDEYAVTAEPAVVRGESSPDPVDGQAAQDPRDVDAPYEDDVLEVPDAVIAVPDTGVTPPTVDLAPASTGLRDAPTSGTADTTEAPDAEVTDVAPEYGAEPAGADVTSSGATGPEPAPEDGHPEPIESTGPPEDADVAGQSTEPQAVEPADAELAGPATDEPEPMESADGLGFTEPVGAGSEHTAAEADVLAGVGEFGSGDGAAPPEHAEASVAGIEAPQGDGVELVAGAGIELPEGGVEPPQGVEVGIAPIEGAGVVAPPPDTGVDLPEDGGEPSPGGGVESVAGAGIELPEGGVELPQSAGDGIEAPQGGGIELPPDAEVAPPASAGDGITPPADAGVEAPTAGVEAPTGGIEAAGAGIETPGGGVGAPGAGIVMPVAPETGEARVDEAVAALQHLGGLSTEEHVSAYEATHSGLQDVLADLDRDPDGS